MPQTPSSSQQVPHQPEEQSPSPTVALSVTTTPSKLVKVSWLTMYDHIMTASLRQITCQFELEKSTAQAEAHELQQKLAPGKWRQH